MIWKLMTKANCTRDSRTGSSSMTRLLMGSRSALEAEDSDLRSPDFGRKGGRYVAGRHRDFLGAVHRVSDHPAADRAADLLAPQLLAGRRVDCIEIGAQVNEDNKD